MQQPQSLQLQQQQEYTRLLATHVAEATEAQELARAAAMKAEQQVSVAQQRSDAIAEVASHEIEAARKASLETVDKVASQLRRDAEIHCAEARAAGDAHVERVKLEADEMHASRIATQSARYDSIVGSKEAELSETRRQLEEVYNQLHAECVENEKKLKWSQPR